MTREVVVAVPGLLEAAWAVRRLDGLPRATVQGLGVVVGADDQVYVFAVVADGAPTEARGTIARVAGEFGQPVPLTLEVLFGRGVKMVTSGDGALILAALALLGVDV